jgi:Domain of unknown function (DUF4258)
VTLRFTDHALRTMAARAITEHDVDMALRHTIGNRPGQPGKIVIQGHAPGGRILNVCVPVADQELIVTAYWQ